MIIRELEIKILLSCHGCCGLTTHCVRYWQYAVWSYFLISYSEWRFSALWFIRCQCSCNTGRSRDTLNILGSWRSPSVILLENHTDSNSIFRHLDFISYYQLCIDIKSRAESGASHLSSQRDASAHECHALEASLGYTLSPGFLWEPFEETHR